MLDVTAVLKSNSPIAFSAPIQTPKNTGENHDAYEERVWRERARHNEDGLVIHNAMAIQNMLIDVAKYLGETIPGQGKKTYTAKFMAGIICGEPLVFGVKWEDVQGHRVFVPSDGRRGGGSRVWKTFPIIHKWETTARFYVVDPILCDKPSKVQEYLEHAGKFIGMGFFRPINGGYYGRFNVESFEFEKV